MPLHCSVTSGTLKNLTKLITNEDVLYTKNLWLIFILSINYDINQYWKVNQSHYRLGVAQRVPGSYGSQISWQRHRMVVRLSALRTGHLYPPGNAPGTHFCQRLSRPQGHSVIRRILCQWKIPMTPAGIDPATFRFVAQHLNHRATAVRINQYLSHNILSQFHHSYNSKPG